MSTIDYSNLIEVAKKQKYEEMKWSKNESLFKITKHIHRSPHSITEVIPVSLVLDIRIKLSCFGRFMKNFNESQAHNFFWNDNNLGIEMYNYINFDESEKKRWNISNDFTDDILGLLKQAVQTKKVIDYSFFYENLRTLRLTNGPINSVDSLTKFTKLEVLVLASNWIKQIRRRDLPPQLLHLECFGNEIKHIKTLCTKSGPQRLKYLGLARNMLDETSGLHLLAESQTYKELRALDIANNEFGSLVRLLEELSSLQQLTALALEGNPCYVCEGYKYNVLAFFPNLLYLDGTEILNQDRPLRNDLFIRHLATKATFHFTCYRIVGLPPPPKSKATHTYYLEIDLPLLEPIRIPRPITTETRGTDTHDLALKQRSESKSLTEVKGGSKKNLKAGEKGKKDPKDSKIKAVDGNGVYAIPNEVDEVENDYLTFRTEEKPWSRTMKFQEPTITIDIPFDDFPFVRDTFKSRIRIKLVYAQRYIYKSSKKNKQVPAEAASKTSFTSGQSRNNSNEVTLKRSTLATFYCNLQPVNWSDQSLDYLWADHPHFGDTATIVDGSLKPEIYEEKSAQQKKQPPVKGESKSATAAAAANAAAVAAANSKNPMPKTLTCNVGFGLRRYTQDNRKLSNFANT